MSNDLISRSLVMDYLREQETNIITEKNKKGFVSADVCDGMISAIGAFKNYIMQVPAAYDSDKVIKELEEYAHVISVAEITADILMQMISTVRIAALFAHWRS